MSDVSDVIMRTRALFEIQSHNVFYFFKNHFQINEFVKSFFLNLPCERNGDQHFIFINLIKSSTVFVLLLKKVLDIVISVCTSYKLSGNS